jgi:tRNA pseudouridine32 synthase/23S rRNA pseudouridine746 synthase/23S rRNA pseudouridine1911/1915/1917 synthase
VTVAVDGWAELRARIVRWEDDEALVVDKPPGLSVMGERHDTDLVTLAAAAGEPLWWVNRIDKVTSGAVVLARTKEAHGWLTRQFARRTVDKAYLAVCHPGGLPPRGTIDLPLLKAGSGRIRVAAERAHIQLDQATGRWYVPEARLLPRKNYPSRTDYRSLWDDGEHAVVLAEPVTGRRHQIRVHLAWTGHAIVGDPLFARQPGPPADRTHLHSLRVAFEAATSGHPWVEVTAEPSPDFWAPVAARLGDPADLLRQVDAALAESSPKAGRPRP